MWYNKIKAHIDVNYRFKDPTYTLSLCSLTKPQSFADCVGDELPVGWEQVLDYNRGVYYVNHMESECFPSGFLVLRKSLF